MRVQLVYRVPVAVVAGTAAATVERVVVLDEDVSLDADAEPWEQDTWRPLGAGDPAVLVASSTRIARDLGWRPERQDLETIVDSAWRWMRGR